ncbi:MAG: hypothetical protein CSA66_03580 [Proteobacteria bacterium]|nr:MAG: hypothetical protein CSA66_03580 [Pseudomonadota bacterium]
MLLRTLKAIAVFVGLILVAALVFLWWASGGETDGALVAPGEIEVLEAYLPDAPLPPAARLDVLTFNVGYGRGPEGDYAGPWTEAHIARHLEGIAAQIATSGADLVALQEVDLGAARSHYIHQGRRLAELLGWPYLSCVRTWENNYVPFPYWPPSRHYGRMVSGQCTLCRYPIARSTRYRLPQPAANPFWRNLFYLNRAIEHAEVTLPGGRTLHVYNVHLEAFDQVNRQRHIERLRELVDDNDSDLVVVLGDFNAPPPEARARDGFPDEPDSDFRGDTTIETARTIRGLSQALPAPEAFTFPAEAPNRRLDYILYRDGLTLAGARVLDQTPVWSDHLPVLASFSLTER